ncbi:MAG: hypothetical protein U0325_12090 [Polyangiales bacterium]
MRVRRALRRRAGLRPRPLRRACPLRARVYLLRRGLRRQTRGADALHCGACSRSCAAGVACRGALRRVRPRR